MITPTEPSKEAMQAARAIVKWHGLATINSGSLHPDDATERISGIIDAAFAEYRDRCERLEQASR